MIASLHCSLGLSILIDVNSTAVCIVYHYHSLIRAFHISVSWWFFTGVWVTASLHKSPGFFSVFWPFSIMPSFGWSPPVSQLPSYCSKRTNYNWYNCHLHFPQFFQFPSKVEVLILHFTFFQFYSVVSRDSKVDNFASSLFFCWLLLSLVFWSRLGDPCVCQSPIGVFECHFLGQVLGCANTICLYGQI